MDQHLDKRGASQRVMDYWPLGLALIVCILILNLPQIIYAVLKFLK